MLASKIAKVTPCQKGLAYLLLFIDSIIIVNLSCSMPIVKDTHIKDTVISTAAVPARGVVQAQAHIKTDAGEKFAAAAEEKHHAATALAHKEAACAEAESARPGAHAKAVFGEIGEAISAKSDLRKEKKAFKKHRDNADLQVKRAYEEKVEAKEAARLQALRQAEENAARTNASKIVSEYSTGKDIVVVAEVPARGATTGVGVAESHATDHLQAAARENALAAAAAAGQEAAEARLDAARPGAEAKAAVVGIPTKIGARLHEAKEWVAEKLHDRKADSLESKGEKILAADIEKAREKAKTVAEAEANRLDRGATAFLTSEQTVSKVTTTTA